MVGARASRTPAARPVLRLTALAVISIILAGAAYAVTVGTEIGQLVGELILGGRPDPSRADAAGSLLARVSRPTLVLGSIVLVLWAVIQGRPRLGVGILVAIAGANLTSQLAKSIFLDRIDQLEGLFYPLSNSFPSGHVTAAASLAVGLLLVVPPVLRTPIAVPSAVLLALVGVSTVALGWHRMADAVGGTLVATAWGAGVSAVLVWRRGAEPIGTRTIRLGRLGSRVLIVAGVLLLTAGLLAYLLAALDPLQVLLVLAERGGSPALFLVGVVIVIGASLASLGAFAYALSDVRLDPRPQKYREAGDQPSDAGG